MQFVANDVRYAIRVARIDGQVLVEGFGLEGPARGQLQLRSELRQLVEGEFRIDLCSVGLHNIDGFSTYIFGAICPQDGEGAALVLPFCNTKAMTLHLKEIAAAVAPGGHAILILDQAGWYISKAFPVPPNMTLVPLPPKSPELNPAENIWQFMRDNWLSNRVFTSYTNIIDHCCYAWNKLVDQPWLIISIGTRQWANRSY